MKEEIEQRRRQRRDFMTELYRVTDGSVSEFVSAYEIGTDILIPNSDIKRLLAYLEEKEFIKVDDHKLGVIRMTANGIDYVEGLSDES